MTKHSTLKKTLIAAFVLFLLSAKQVTAGSYSLSSLGLGSTATLTAVADAASCQNKENQMVNQFDLTALTLNDQGVMVGNASPVIDLQDVKIESLTIANKIVTNFPVISRSSWGYIYQIDPPISFGSNHKATIKASNIKIASKGKAKAWFVLTSNTKGIPCISSGTFTFSIPSTIPQTTTTPLKTTTPTIAKETKATPNPTPTALSTITPITPINPQANTKTSFISTIFSQIRNFILSLFKSKA